MLVCVLDIEIEERQIEKGRGGGEGQGGLGKRESESINLLSNMAAFPFRYLKYHKRCLNDRKKLGIGCSEVDFYLNLCCHEFHFPRILKEEKK